MITKNCVFNLYIHFILFLDPGSYFLKELSLIHMFPGYHKNLAFYTTSLDDNFLISHHLLV